MLGRKCVDTPLCVVTAAALVCVWHATNARYARAASPRTKRVILASAIRATGAIAWPAALTHIVPSQDRNSSALMWSLAWNAGMWLLDATLMRWSPATDAERMRPYDWTRRRSCPSRLACVDSWAPPLDARHIDMYVFAVLAHSRRHATSQPQTGVHRGTDFRACKKRAHVVHFPACGRGGIDTIDVLTSGDARRKTRLLLPFFWRGRCGRICGQNVHTCTRKVGPRTQEKIFFSAYPKGDCDNRSTHEQRHSHRVGGVHRPSIFFLASAVRIVRSVDVAFGARHPAVVVSFAIGVRASTIPVCTRLPVCVHNDARRHRACDRRGSVHARSRGCTHATHHMIMRSHGHRCLKKLIFL